MAWSGGARPSPEVRRCAPISIVPPSNNGASGAHSSGPGEHSDRGASLESGIGGSRNPAQLKCLHAHVAFALAQPGYRIGEAILAEAIDPWPSDACCFPVVESAS